MLARATSFAVEGLAAVRVCVEFDIRPGLPAFNVIGLSAGAVRESRERVRAAILNAGFSFPRQRVTANLAPAHVEKSGASFDLALACGLLAASEQVSGASLEGVAFFAELALSGELRACRGALAAAEAAADAGMSLLIVARASAAEAAELDQLRVAGLGQLREVAALLAARQGAARAEPRRAGALVTGGRLDPPGRAGALVTGARPDVPGRDGGLGRPGRPADAAPSLRALAGGRASTTAACVGDGPLRKPPAETGAPATASRAPATAATSAARVDAGRPGPARSRVGAPVPGPSHGPAAGGAPASAAARTPAAARVPGSARAAAPAPAAAQAAGPARSPATGDATRGVPSHAAARQRGRDGAVASATPARTPTRQPGRRASDPPDGPDLADVRGQRRAIRALTIAATGGHHLLLSGPPGVGKTMLARRLPGLLPPLDREEALEVTKIHGIAGEHVGGGLVERRPFRAPHHSVSAIGLVGGGPLALPGEAVLAHHGVLFLDELTEFSRAALEALRAPLESGRVVIVRRQRSAAYPTRFILVAAMNPCPCGHLGDAGRRCRCTEAELGRHRTRLSAPMLDRIDLVVRVSRPTTAELRAPPLTNSASVRQRVAAARERRAARPGTSAGDGELGVPALRDRGEIDEPAEAALRRAYEVGRLSMRGHARALRVARTVADLDGSGVVGAAHVAVALSLHPESAMATHRTGRGG